MRLFDRDLIRGGHYGQRSCEPHQKAEHMAAPTNAAKREKSSCQHGAVHTWHLPDMSGRPEDVRSWGAGSTGRRNTGVKSLCWGFKLQGLTWPFVEPTSHFVQIGL